MAKQINLIPLLLLVLLIALQPLARAQQPEKSHGDTLIDRLNASGRYKDGYSFANRVINIPDGIATLCDKKQTRIVGRQVTYRSPAYYIDKKGNKNYVQGRADPLYKDSIVSSYFTFASISVWNDTTNVWDVVYKK